MGSSDDFCLKVSFFTISPRYYLKQRIRSVIAKEIITVCIQEKGQRQES